MNELIEKLDQMHQIVEDLLDKAMCRTQHHIGADQGASAEVARTEEVSIVEATPNTDLMSGTLHCGLSAIDDASRIDIKARTYLILA